MSITSPNERLIDSFGTHWMKYVTPTFVYVLLMLIIVLLFVFSQFLTGYSHASGAVAYFFTFALLVGIHHWYFHRILSEYMMDIVVTTKRFMFLRCNLFLSDDTHEISLDRILAVEAKKRGIIQNILGYGTLWFDTGGTSTDKGPIIPLVPHPHRRVREIMSLLRTQGS
ncbi:hypothetical protein COU80_04475 [Candidatus Peregrinibacteria bacterium CG10_big_fil_rev_8_21_14_0_10_55_24]|nr:MAG: hypothetical protein COU80_04475 [Candidatus Peregrinibacteria bacterium CG10_big_fil_rev_8_21_14_0_10_55_24]